jgi:hypothetical protein
MQSYSNHFITSKQKKKESITTNDQLFLIWMDKIELIILEKTNNLIQLLDLPDQMYRVSYDNWMTITEMIDIIASNTFMELI